MSSQLQWPLSDVQAAAQHDGHRRVIRASRTATALFNARPAVADAEAKIARHFNGEPRHPRKAASGVHGLRNLTEACHACHLVARCRGVFGIADGSCDVLHGHIRFASHCGDRKQGAVWHLRHRQHIYPVFLLHAVRLPINILKLVRLQPANRERGTELPTTYHR